MIEAGDIVESPSLHKETALQNTGLGKHVLIWIGLCAYLVLSLFNLQDVVLCFEKTGEVSLEIAINGICCDSFQMTEKTGSQATVNTKLMAAKCQQCVDVPVNLHGAKHLQHGSPVFQSSLDVTPLAASVPVTIGYLSRVTEESLPQPPPEKPAVHLFLSTVVLLI